MSTRYATIITDDDGNEVVSSIAQHEGPPPNPTNGRVQKVADGVRIGMIAGGTIEKVGGFGFVDPTGAPVAPKATRRKVAQD